VITNSQQDRANFFMKAPQLFESGDLRLLKLKEVALFTGSLATSLHENFPLIRLKQCDPRPATSGR